MSMKTRSLTALALVSVLLLSACAADPAATGISEPRSTATTGATSTPDASTREADPLDGVTSGEPIDAELASTINAAWREYTHDKAYPMPDGTFVLIKGGEPLPENVKTAIAGVLTPLSAAASEPGKYDDANAAALRDARIAQEEASGRKVTFVTHAWNAMPTGGHAPRWSTDAKTMGFHYNGTSKDEAIAAAQSWVDKSPTVRALVVLDTLQ